MRTLKAKHAFSAYPDGKVEKFYHAGEEILADDDFAELLLGKSHVDEPAGKPAAKPAIDKKGDA